MAAWRCAFSASALLNLYNACAGGLEGRRRVVGYSIGTRWSLGTSETYRAIGMGVCRHADTPCGMCSQQDELVGALVCRYCKLLDPDLSGQERFGG